MSRCLVCEFFKFTKDDIQNYKLLIALNIAAHFRCMAYTNVLRPAQIRQDSFQFIMVGFRRFV